MYNFFWCVKGENESFKILTVSKMEGLECCRHKFTTVLLQYPYFCFQKSGYKHSCKRWEQMLHDPSTCGFSWHVQRSRIKRKTLHLSQYGSRWCSWCYQSSERQSRTFHLWKTAGRSSLICTEELWSFTEKVTSSINSCSSARSGCTPASASCCTGLPVPVCCDPASFAYCRAGSWKWLEVGDFLAQAEKDLAPPRVRGHEGMATYRSCRNLCPLRMVVGRACWETGWRKISAWGRVCCHLPGTVFGHWGSGLSWGCCGTYSVCCHTVLVPGFLSSHHQY